MIRTVAASFLAAVALTVHAETPGDYAYRLPLTTAGDAAFFGVELPAKVYEGAVRRDLGDVRVFNADGAPAAFAFMPRPADARAAPASVALPLFPLRVETGRRDLGDIAITLKRDAAGTTVDLATRDGELILRGLRPQFGLTLFRAADAPVEDRDVERGGGEVAAMLANVRGT